MGTDSPPDRKASSELMLRAFGPLADALGQELEKAPSFVVRNLVRLATVFRRKRKVEDDNGGEPSPRLFRHIIDEASWADDDIVTEYLGGVLASSTADTLRDRGVNITATIRQLSAVQLRAHYIFYSEILRLSEPRQYCDLRLEGSRGTLHLDVGGFELLTALGIANQSVDSLREVLTHVVLGLAREQLIDQNTFRLPDWTRQDVRPAIAIHPSPLGAELFLWGCGSPVTDQARLFDTALELMPIDGIWPLESSRLDEKKDSFELARRRIERLILNGDLDEAWSLLDESKEDAKEDQLAPVNFYTSVLAMLRGDGAHAFRSMEKCADAAGRTQIRTGLDTISKISSEYPSRQQDLINLAKVLESARK